MGGKKMRLNKQPAISVIVPVYNVEKYLRQCLDSIIGQIFEDMEIIVVNDGSTDSSLAIINEYAEKDNRIQIIDKPNEGYGKTMNRGIEAASGEYIGIVESDDWIEPDMYETLYNIAKSHDVEVVKSDFIRFNDETGKDEHKPHIPEQDAQRIINPHHNYAIFYTPPSIWSAIYKREFLNNKKIRFLETPGASHQDTAFNFKIWAMAERIYLTRKPLVHYRISRPGQSITNKNNVFCVSDEFHEVERYMASHPILFKNLEKIFHRAKYNTYTWNLSRLEGKNKEAFYKQMQLELTPALERGTIDLTGMTSKHKLKLLKMVYPKSTWLKIRYTLGNLTRWLIKDRQRNDCMETRVLFGLVIVWKKALVYKGGGV